MIAVGHPPVALLLALTAVMVFMVAGSSPLSAEEIPAWEQTRTLDQFKALLAHSPFSLPTAEQSSPLAERYALTGIISMDGVEQVFVFDRTDQSRDLVGRTPNAKGMSLVSVLKDAGEQPKASVTIGGETGTIGFMESSAKQGQPPVPTPAQPGSPASAGQPTPVAVQLPPLPPLPQIPNGSAQPGRRIIRRPVINAPQPPPHP